MSQLDEYICIQLREVWRTCSIEFIRASPYSQGRCACTRSSNLVCSGVRCAGMHVAPALRLQLRQAVVYGAVHLLNVECISPVDMKHSSWKSRGILRQDGCPDASLTAMFTFVARDPITRKSMAVNPLQPQTPEQRRLFAERQRVADERRAARQQQPAGPASSAGEKSAMMM
jgi:hypothetical protein